MKLATTAFVQNQIGSFKTSEFAANKTANGYQKLPSGLIIQWGRLTGIPYDGSKSFSLPITFPNSILTSYATIENSFVTAGGNYSVYTQQTNSQVIVLLDGNDSISPSAKNAWIFAIGY